MMTTNTTTVNPSASLNFERMTHGYFYPNVFADDISQVKIPTIAELEFLGAGAIRSIKEFLRHEDKKLQKLLKNARKELRSIEGTPHDAVKMIVEHDPQCDWRGTGCATLYLPKGKDSPNDEEWSKLCKALRKETRKVYTCKFGSEIAKWCQKNPWPCNSSLTCTMYHVMAERAMSTGGGSGEDADKKLEGCPHYDVCNGTMPLQHEECIFASADQKMLDDCGRYLQERVDSYRQRLGFIKKYMHNLKGAKLLNKPLFDQLGNDTVTNATPGERIVQIDPDSNLKEGIFAGIITDDGEHNFMLINMEDGEAVKLKLRNNWRKVESGYNFYMTKYDFTYLLDNPEFYRVWQQMSFCKNVALVNAIANANAKKF